MICWSSWFCASTYTLTFTTSIALRSRIFLVWAALPHLNRIDYLSTNPTSSILTWPQFQLPFTDLPWFDPVSKGLCPIQSRTDTSTHRSSVFRHHTSSLMVVAAWQPSIGWLPCSPPSLGKCSPCDCLLSSLQISAAGQRWLPGWELLPSVQSSESLWEPTASFEGILCPRKTSNCLSWASAPHGQPPST